jgi:uncharacterized membrane protein YdjX (TVP38/TMEM64 family)
MLWLHGRKADSIQFNLRDNSMRSKNLIRLSLLGAGLLAVFLFLYLDLEHYLTLSYLQESHARFQRLYAAHQVPVLGGYILLYIAVTALSLPGAAVMTLAGGALFGFWTGTIAVSFASSIGATLACAVSRFLLRDWVQSRFADKLVAINRGIETEGAFYLFTLRLIPVFPFFIINLAMGLTKLRLSTYYLVSQLGMLPATMVYVNAGRELGRLESLSGILSPRLLISFILLGVFPLAAKKSVELYRRKLGPASKDRP